MPYELENPLKGPISLGGLVLGLKASLVFASGPEFGAKRARTGGSTGDHSVKTMVILEEVINELNTLVADSVENNVDFARLTFVFAVDYKGSVASSFASSRVHYASGGNVVRGVEDFTAERGSALADAGVTTTNGHIGAAVSIENSFWVSFWRGQVTGALSATLQSATEIDNFRKDGNIITIMGHKGEASKMKCTICLTIDGGPITQVEKSLIPDICKSVRTNMRMRGLRPGTDCLIIWCHFPTPEDVLRSLRGYKNLVIDRDGAHQFDRVCAIGGEESDATFNYIPTTFSCKSELDEQDAEKAIIFRTVEELMNVDDNIYQKIVSAVAGRDEKCACFQLQRAGQLSRKEFDVLIEQGCFSALPDFVQMLAERDEAKSMADGEFKELVQKSLWPEKDMEFLTDGITDMSNAIPEYMDHWRELKLWSASGDGVAGQPQTFQPPTRAP